MRRRHSGPQATRPAGAGRWRGWVAWWSAVCVGLMPVVVRAQAGGMDKQGAAMEGRRIFWRLEKPTGGRLFLLGSLHFGDHRLYPLPEVVEAAYRQADTVILETDLRHTVQPILGDLMRRKAELPPAVSLADVLPPAALTQFRVLAMDLGMNALAFERFRAWYCANHLMSFALRRAGVDPARGIDQVFCGRAGLDGKTLETLETLEFQVDLFAGLDDRQAAALLTEALADVSQVRAFADHLLEAYTRGDLAALEGLINASFAEVPDLRRRFLTDRNAAWMQALKAWTSRPGDQLVVVGTGHLLGADGLVARFRALGFRVVRE